MKSKPYTVIVLIALALCAVAAGVWFAAPRGGHAPLPAVSEPVWGVFSGNFNRAKALSPPQALSFEPLMKDLRDQPVAWQSLRGKVTVVNFWALWCPPCIKELPSLMTLAAERADQGDFAVVYVSMDFPENGASLSEVMAIRRVVPVDTLYISDTASWDALGLRALPTTLILDRDGQVAYRLEGDIDWAGEDARAFLDALLGKTDSSET